MTTSHERYRAILQAKELLQELESGKLTDISEIQRWARGVLRHYPDKMELDIITQVNNQNPIFGCMLSSEIQPTVETVEKIQRINRNMKHLFNRE